VKTAIKSERRSAFRQNVASVVYLDLQPNNGGILLNLNDGGMRVSVAHPLIASRTVHFSFVLDARSKVEGTGRIAWISESGRSAGIRFVQLSENSLGQISNWMKTASSSVIEPIKLEPRSAQPVQTEIAKPKEEIDSSAGVRPTSGRLLKFPIPLSATLGAEKGSEGKASKLTVPESHDLSDSQSGGKYSTPAPSRPEPAKEAYTPSLTYSLYGIERLIETGDPTSARKTRASEIEVALPTGPETHPPIPEAEVASPAPPQEPATEQIQAPLMVQLGDDPPSVGLNEPLPIYCLAQSPSKAPTSSSLLLSQIVGDELRQLGWGLERDWHVSVGILLTLGGLVALWISPSLIMMTVACWTVGAIVLISRKQPPADWKHQGHN
jgi:hypothetical protein